MKTATPAATSRSRDAGDAPAVEETVRAHAGRVCRAKVCGRITAMLDTVIGRLQRLREKVGGAPVVEEEDERPGARSARPRERQEAAAAAPVEAAKPKRRLLRALLIYLSVLLLGAAGATALAYTLFQAQLDQQLKDSHRREAALMKKTRPSAALQQAFEAEQARRAAAEKKLAATLREYSASTSDSYDKLEALLGEQLAETRRLETALADSAKARAETRKALDEAQVQRTEAEKKLVEATQAAGEKQKQLDAAEKQLRRLGAAQLAEPAAAPSPGRRSSRASAPSHAGNCTLDPKNIHALKDCIDDFNR